MEQRRVILEMHSQGLAIITIDNPPVNSLSPQVFSELSDVFKQVNAQAHVKAIVLTGGNNKFSGGADIKSMSKDPKSEKKEGSFLELVNNLVEGNSKPVVAAIVGFALGGGLELAMACHARVAAPDSRLGLPELQLGIIPGLGGTQRLPRLVGVEKAINMMLSSKMITGVEALEAGLVDMVCSHGEIIKRAKDYALDISNHVKPLMRTLERTDKLEHNALDIINAAKSKAKKTYKHVEYPFICLDVIEHGILHGGVQGTVLERKLGVETVKSLAAKALMHVFLAERTAYKVPGVTDGKLKPRSIKRVGVIGGGLMGSGIATSLILHNVQVFLKEVDGDRLQSAITRVHLNLKSRVSKGSLSKEQFQDAINNLIGTVDYKGFDTVDLVIEAVIESEPLKKRIFQEIDKVCSKDCIFASNTSSFDLSVITEDVSFPERIAGAHFFSPAHVMRLVEVVHTPKTSKQSICDLITLSKTINKIPVVVKNVPGFAVNRVFVPYNRTAAFLVDLGVHPYRIDSVLKDFGMPMGPYRLVDMAGLQIGTYVSGIFRKEFGDRMYSSELADLMVKANRVGEAVGKGYYNYHGSRQEHPAPELDDILSQSRKLSGVHSPEKAANITDKDIIEMIFFPVVNEAVKVVEENVVIRASDLDIASILGMGFPSFRGGIIFWAETIGLNNILRKLEQWQGEYGPCFRPTASLHKLVACNTPMSKVGAASRL